MNKKLTKDELKKKVKFHKNKTVYYEKKIEKIDKEKRRIGFIHYD